MKGVLNNQQIPTSTDVFLTFPVIRVDRKLPCFLSSGPGGQSLHVGQPCAAAATKADMSWGASAGSWSCHPVPVRPDTGCCAKFWCLQFKGCGLSGKDSKEGRGQRTKNPSCVERLNQLCLHYLEKTGLQGT